MNNKKLLDGVTLIHTLFSLNPSTFYPSTIKLIV
jgi:hypothetical protein